uniref:Uncharacterized protein n=1 Tax=Anguilla anguilla TaxID=7936 RepID=A0A0E9TZF4_ANGAN
MPVCVCVCVGWGYAVAKIGAAFSAPSYMALIALFLFVFAVAGFFQSGPYCDS